MRDEIEQEESHGWRQWRHRWRRRWAEIYESNALLRHLIHEPLFLIALLFVIGSSFGIALMLPKIWDPAPPGFSKSVRVSLLDYLQAWALRGAARRAEAAGDWEKAVASWRAAIGNNIADPTSHRGALEHLRRAPRIQSSNLPLVFFSGETLVELTHTNRADALLFSAVAERHRVPEIAIELLRPLDGQFTDAEEVVYARALVSSGRFGAFAARRAAHAALYAGDPVTALYVDALDALGTPGASVPALDRLRTATAASSPHRNEAARLLCLAASSRNDLADYEHGLQILRELRSTMVPDEVAWWDLLARNGRRDEAIQLAKAYDAVPPPTPFEAVQLVQAWSNLGLDDLALDMLKNHAERYGVVPDVWGAYLDLLFRRRDWREVRRIASNLRANAAIRDDVLAVAWYADAVADLAEDRRTSVREALKRLQTIKLPNPRLTLRIATGLGRIGEFATATNLLQRGEKELETIPEYWFQVIACSQGVKDVAGMRRGVDRLLELAPQNALALSLRIALLLVTREDPPEALAQSIRLLNAGVDSTAVRINHAAALLQNRRSDEAIVLLDSIDPEMLSADERTAWLMARAEALAQQGRPGEAYEVGSQVDLSKVLPPEASWFKEFLESCRLQALVTTP